MGGICVKAFDTRTIGVILVANKFQTGFDRPSCVP